MKINVFVSNLGKYNEGMLTGSWTSLPVKNVNEDILDKIISKDVTGNYINDWFISDYEAPFEIDEFEDLYQLNELAKALKHYDDLKSVFNDLDDNTACSVPEVVEFNEAGIEDLVGGDTTMEVIRKGCFGDISWNDDYIYIDGNGNLSSISEKIYQDWLKNDSDQIIEEFKKEQNI